MNRLEEAVTQLDRAVARLEAAAPSARRSIDGCETSPAKSPRSSTTLSPGSISP
jgi:hypothetical protein